MATKPTSTLITDRTAADVANRTSKGFNNFSDVKRVQDWVNYLIEENGLDLTLFSWSNYERVDQSNWENRILNNITELLKKYPDLHYIVPSAAGWDYQKQNQIESILLAMSNSEPVKDPDSFSMDDWGTIVSAINRGIYKNYYHVGDTRTEQMKDGTNCIFSISDIDGNLDSFNSGIESKYSLLISGGISEKEYQYHNTDIGFSTDNRLTWGNSDMRNVVMEEIKNNLQNDIKNRIKKVKIFSQYGYTSSLSGSDEYNSIATYDDLFIEGNPFTRLGNQTLPQSIKEQDFYKWTRDVYESDKNPVRGRSDGSSGVVSVINPIVTERMKIRWFFCL